MKGPVVHKLRICTDCRLSLHNTISDFIERVSIIYGLWLLTWHFGSGQTTNRVYCLYCKENGVFIRGLLLVVHDHVYRDTLERKEQQPAGDERGLVQLSTCTTRLHWLQNCGVAE